MEAWVNMFAFIMRSMLPIAIKDQTAETEFFILISKDQIKQRKTQLYIGVYSENKKLETIKTSFLGPVTN
jgi:hypothetical protein